ncbi:hypothetical protein Tco_0487553 [Tanacetum coccineum]
MDPNNSDAYDHYDIYFQSDYDRYMRDYQAYEHYVALCEQEAGGANNDLNVLYGSPLFDDELADTSPECPFVVNGHTYRKCYYLADGIYPAWSTFVKSFSVARDEKSLKFKRVQEAARKDIKRAFRVLQGAVLHFADVAALFENGTRRTAPLL